MPRAESQHRQQHISTTGWATSALQTLRWIVPLALVALYVSAVMTPPQRHTELVAVAAAERNDVLPWDQHEFARDWVVGSLVYEKPVAGWTTAMAPNDTASATSDSANLASSWTHSVESYVDRIGDFLMLLLGLDDDEDDSTLSGTQSSGLNTWAESSIYVERTHSLYASRPSSFGPHILHEPLAALLYPITSFAATDSYACSVNKSDAEPPFEPPKQGWVALVERGRCHFSVKVRLAQDRGAVAVVFGDQSASEGGIGRSGGLLTPWSPDDTSDIRIPSAFVSRSSYLSLLDTWAAEQDTPPADKPMPAPSGLLVILSKDELFAWPLLDLLILVLFLPSLLTLLTVFTQRLRIIRQRQRDRAPRDAVSRLSVFTWGEDEEKTTAVTVAAAENAEAAETASEQHTHEDEERQVGVAQPAASEATPLLPSSDAPSTSRLHAARAFASRYVPRRVARALGLRSHSHHRHSQLAPATGKHQFRRRGTTEAVECAICLCDFEKGDRVTELPCGHLFHESEITPWLLETRRHCPICRASITADSDEEDENSQTPATASAATESRAPAQLPLNVPATAANADVDSTSDTLSSSAPAALSSAPPPLASSSRLV